ncbi:uncharacterized protein LOC129808727 [Phlebotomus papatasi]|uniref:uncharacterized protein LOC129808727 n=1 Tax=Phlebotomus papatasi TaxID=29031 RepID=UPI002483860E|nr:uncharacterized protein LOC129808727 [Phlebotomus papatasi]
MCDFSEEEEVLILYTAFVLCKRTRQAKRRRVWAREWLLTRPSHGFVENLYDNIASGDFFGHNDFLRMTSEEFEELLQIVGPYLQKKTTKMREPIPPKSRLIITLRHLATGESQSSLTYLFVIAQNTISNIINETAQFLYQCLSNKYLNFPDKKEDWLKIAEDYYKKWNFVCIGALDGKHCEIQSPPNSGSMYFNYKQKKSIVLLAICDAYYRFAFIT